MSDKNAINILNADTSGAEKTSMAFFISINELPHTEPRKKSRNQLRKEIFLFGIKKIKSAKLRNV